MPDTVFIEDLRVDTLIGINDWEREVEQTLHFDVHFEIDTSQCVKGDDLSLSVDYAMLSQFITDFVQADKSLLIETLSNRLADALLQAYPRIEVVTLTLRKPQALPTAACSGIRLTRQR